MWQRPSLDELLKIWIDKNAAAISGRNCSDRDIHIAAFRHFYDLTATDDVDILAKVGFDLVQVPERRDRVDSILGQRWHLAIESRRGTGRR